MRENWQSNYRYWYGEKNAILKNEKCWDFLTEKGVYPYDCMNTFDKFDEEQLESKEQIYSRLSKEDITNGDYKKAM